MGNKGKITRTSNNIDKDKRINVEEKRIRESCGKLTDEQMIIADGLIRRAAYIRIKLEDYETDLDEKGYVELFSQSDKTEPYERERPTARLYIAETKNYQNLMKQIMDMIPKNDGKKVVDDDGFENFVKDK